MRVVGDLAGLLAAGLVPAMAYLAVGLWVLRGLRIAPAGVERVALAYVTGTGVASLAILLLRALDVSIPLPALAVVAAAGAPLLRGLGGRRAVVRNPAWVRAADTAALVAGLLTFAAALAPETSWDGFEYHLPLARAWSEGPIRALPGVLDAEFRAGIDLLYIPAATAGRPAAAAAVSACFALTLAVLIRAEATRRAGAGAGALAGLFSLVVAFSLENAPTTYVDLGVGATGFVALLAADRWNRGGDARDLWLAALCVAVAANAKLHAAVLAPAVVAIVVLGGRPPGARTLAGCAGIAAFLVAPWLFKAALTAGNPFFPFLGAWFGTGPTTEEVLSLRRFRLTTDFPASRDPLGLLHYAVSLFFGRNPHLSGQLGPLPLALAPFAWSRPSRATGVLIGTLALLFVLQFAFMPALRFGAPLLPFAAIAAAVGGARIARSGAVARSVLALALAALALHHGAAALSRYAPRAAALLSPDAYARSVFPDQAALRGIVADAPGVVGIPGGAVLWMPKPVYLLLWERNGELFFRDFAGRRHGLLRRRTPPAEALALLRARGVSSVVVDVSPPLPKDGTVGQRTVDAWVRAGLASRRDVAEPPRARAGRVWVRVDLTPPGGG